MASRATGKTPIRTTMRLPARTIAILDAHRGHKNRTEFMIELVDKIGSKCDGSETARCDGIKRQNCERTRNES